MTEKTYRASLCEGRYGWCVIFRHPVRKTINEKQQLRVRRGLGTRDEAEAQNLVGQLNEILSEPSYWSPASREKAASRFEHRVVAAFYDCVNATDDAAAELCDTFLPLPGKDDGYTTVQLIGTTGAGKTTLVRQLLGRHPKRERFPSTSAAKTTVSDFEVILASGPFRAVVSFLPRERVRQYIMECVITAVAARVEGNSEDEIIRRLMEHNDQKFRLSYILGHLQPETRSRCNVEFEDENDLDDSVQERHDGAGVTPEEQEAMSRFLVGVLDRIRGLARGVHQRVEETAKEVGIEWESTSTRKA